jgi:hypothetical protein
MTTENNKSSYSLPLLIILPLRKFRSLFRKAEANFVTGILIGAIFSLFVNILTNQIGESITRQKSLEALEIEINSHHLLNTAMINDYSQGSYKKSKIHFYQIFRYDDHVWKSLGSTTFFYSLPPNTQAELSSYYQFILDGENNTLSSNDQIAQSYQAKLVECLVGGGNCDKETATFNDITDYYTQRQYDIGLFIDKYDFNISKDFHPTRDRLNDPVLSLLMGKQAVKSLALPWK